MKMRNTSSVNTRLLTHAELLSCRLMTFLACCSRLKCSTCCFADASFYVNCQDKSLTEGLRFCDRSIYCLLEVGAGPFRLLFILKLVFFCFVFFIPLKNMDIFLGIYPSMKVAFIVVLSILLVYVKEGYQNVLNNNA